MQRRQTLCELPRADDPQRDVAPNTLEGYYYHYPCDRSPFLGGLSTNDSTYVQRRRTLCELPGADDPQWDLAPNTLEGYYYYY